MPSSSLQSRTTSRRRLLGTAAWAAPVATVATAAPAIAASPCSTVYPYRLAWGGAGSGMYKQQSNSSGFADVPAIEGGGNPIRVDIESQRLGTVPYRSFNLNGYTRTYGGRPEGSTVLALTQGLETGSMDAKGRNAGQLVTFTFSRPVTNLTFTIIDIDVVFNTSEAGWVDNVEVSGTRDGTVTNTAQVTGAGIQSNPWRPADIETSFDLPDSSSNGNVVVTFTGPIDSFTLRYYNTHYNLTGQVIYLGDFRWDALGC